MDLKNSVTPFTALVRMRGATDGAAGGPKRHGWGPMTPETEPLGKNFPVLGKCIVNDDPAAARFGIKVGHGVNFR
jgi:hypothetical protein